MGPTVINGLPAHVFLVHLVVVFVPVAALLLVLGALWRAVRQRLGVMIPVVALVALAMIPLTTHAGEWLIRRVDASPAVLAHEELADGLLPWSAGVFVVAVAVWLLFEKSHWFRGWVSPVEQPAPELVGAGVGAGTATTETATAPVTPARPSPGWLRVARVVAVVAALAVSVGSVVEVYRIGDSGAQAAWHDGFSMTPDPKSAGG